MSKLYVLVDKKLSRGQKLAQSAHAVAQFLLEKPGLWNNDTIVILDAPVELIQKPGAITFLDSYWGYPRAAAFLEGSHDIDVGSLALAK